MVTVAGGVTMIYYNQVLNVSVALCGTAFLIAAMVDAISDPLVGAISDNVRTRWGRRHPLMLLSAFPIAACFYLIYQPPPRLGEAGLFLWLTGSLVALGIAKDFFAIPHTALGGELTDDYHERTSVFGWSAVVGAIGTIAIGVFLYAGLFPSTPGLDNGLLNRAHYQALAIFGSIVVFSTVLICTFSTADQIAYLHRNAKGADQQGYESAARETWRNIRSLVTNRSYLAVCLSWFVLAISAGVIGTIGAYAQLYGFEFTTEELALLRFVTIPGIILCVPLSAFLTRRIDKKYTVVVMTIVTCILLGSPYTLKLFGLFPENHSPLVLPMFFILTVLAYIGYPVVAIVINSQLVDVADEHELRTGNRAEGLIFAARLFAVKATTGLGAVIAGLGLEMIKFPRNARAGDLDSSVIDGLMFMMGPIYYMIVFAGVGLALMYGIDRQRHDEILRELEVRRNQVARPAAAPPASLAAKIDAPDDERAASPAI